MLLNSCSVLLSDFCSSTNETTDLFMGVWCLRWHQSVDLAVVYMDVLIPTLTKMKCSNIVQVCV